jgi:LmbE family N-acetylglucosaminyl deacetylase
MNIIESFAKARVLVLGAHPDDEMGCGGILGRLADAGAEIHHYYFSTCAISTQGKGFAPEDLLAECEKSRDLLGISKTGRGGYEFPVRQFPQYRQEILDALIGLRKIVSPDLVFTATTDDIHQDHSTLTTEAIRAFKGTSIFGYEMPWNLLQQRYDCLVALTEQELVRKIEAVMSYKSQAKSPYLNADFMRSLARVRGVQAGCDFAEAFQIIRLMIR